MLNRRLNILAVLKHRELPIHLAYERNGQRGCAAIHGNADFHLLVFERHQLFDELRYGFSAAGPLRSWHVMFNVEVRGAARGDVRRREPAYSASPRLPG